MSQRIIGLCGDDDEDDFNDAARKDSDSDSDLDETKQRLARLTRNWKTGTISKRARDDVELHDTEDDSDSDSDDEDQDAKDAEARAKIKALEAGMAKRKAKRKAKEARKLCKYHGLTFVFELPPSKIEKLEKITDPVDRRLQQLLWELRCDFALYEHQFKGVRDLARVSADFPGEEMHSVEGDNKNESRFQALCNAKLRRESDDHGVLLADVMGLGKTVQAVAAIILRNAVATAKGEPRKPTLISSPNEAVLNQWKEHLLKAGVYQGNIVRFKTKQSDPLESKNTVFLCTRYDLQAEAKYIFQSLPPLKRNRQPVNAAAKHKSSPLFSNATEELLRVLDNQYKHTKGKAKNKYNGEALRGRGNKLSNEAVVTKYLKMAEREMSQGRKDIFRMVVVDEAHVIRNLKTFWGMAAGLISLHTERIVLLTGTPFNNNNQDMAALMTYINPSDESATLGFWKRATAPRKACSVVERLAKWTSLNVLRREKTVIAHLLPEKAIRKEVIPETKFEVYDKYEKKIIFALKRVHQLSGGEDKRALQCALDMMLGCASCMQLALIHPMLPKGGRQLSVLFSPSLCMNNAAKKRLEKADQCVCCNRRVKLASKNSKKKGSKDTAALDLDNPEDEYEEDIDDVVDELDELDRDDNEDSDRDVFILQNIEERGRQSNKSLGTGDILPIESYLCRFAGKGIRHFACETCLSEIKSKGETCPMCDDLLSRSGFETIETTVGAPPEPGEIGPGHIYCRDIFGGFIASAKLEKIVSNFNTEVPANDKVLIISFFKGSLDFLERMFYEHKVGVARFDGDIKDKARQEALDRFKADPSCRILLMTAQTGGTGLNIAEANHVWFMDRYWNPMVLEQCEDRCHRIGQKKDVEVVYHDVPLTLDDVMRFINVAKKDNASIVLSDSVVLRDSSVNFKDLSGFLGKAISALREAREMSLGGSAESILENVIEMNGDELPSFLSAQKGQSSTASRNSVNVNNTEMQDDAFVWSCGMCTLLNVASAQACDACNTERAPSATFRRMMPGWEYDDEAIYQYQGP